MVNVEGGQLTEALVCSAVGAKIVPGRLVLEPPRAAEVVVKICASGICATDLHLQHGDIPYRFPCVLGHEGAGIVVALGSACTSLEIGDKVLITGASCGACCQCRDGHPAYCESHLDYCFSGARIDGTPVASTADGEPVWASLFGGSTFARHTVCLEASCIKVDPDSDLTLYAPLSCGIVTGAASVFNLLKPTPGSTLAVYGIGAVGAAAVMAANTLPLAKIIAIDIMPERLATARTLGATDVINSREEDVHARIMEITGGKGVNYVAEATGVISVLEGAFKSLSLRGTIASVGAPPVGATVSIDVFSLLIRGITYVGSCAGDANYRVSIPALVELYKRGRFPLDQLVQTFGFDEMEEALAAMKAGSCVKPVLVWKDELVNGSQ